MTKVSNADAPSYLQQREEFKSQTGNLSAEWEQASISRGRLPEPWATDLLALVDDTVNVYVVYSYTTPIAWWAVGWGWTQPSLRYSSTTSRHQALVRKAIAAESVAP